MIRSLVVLLLVLQISGSLGFQLSAQEPAISLRERFEPGQEHRVTSHVELSGELSIPVEPGKPAEKVSVQGKSAIDYDERLLPVDHRMADQRALRVYRKIDFQRTVGDQKQSITLRPEIRRLVMMKRQTTKVPFSPDGPLTWGEIDMLRTDVFVPALSGIYPDKDVKPGDSWRVGDDAVIELTDLDKIEQGGLTCRFEETIRLNDRRAAHITFTGEVRGVNEDGPVRHKLWGRLYVDLATNSLCYLSINGEHQLLDAGGKQVGKVEGKFVLVRYLQPRNAELSDEAIKNLTLEPNQENTRLLYENTDLGMRFTYPRNWRVVREQNNRITLDEANGNGLLITVETPRRLPSVRDYSQESQTYLTDQLKAKVKQVSPPARLAEAPRELDRFSIDAEIAGQRVVMVYLVARQQYGGATFAARLNEREQPERRKEIEGIARSFQLSKPLPTR